MGCLAELIFEFVFEVIVEVVGTLYIKLMTLFVPDHQFSEKLRKRIKNGVTVFASLLFLCAFFGFFMFIGPPSKIKTVGAYMLFIPLAIMGLQLISGIIYRIVRRRKSR